MKGSSGADTILEPVRERGSTGKTWVGETRASVMIADRTTLSIAKAGELVGVTRRTIGTTGSPVARSSTCGRPAVPCGSSSIHCGAIRMPASPGRIRTEPGKTSQHPQRSERRAAPAAGTAAARLTRALVWRAPASRDRGFRTVRPQPVREAWSTGAEVAGAPVADAPSAPRESQVQTRANTAAARIEGERAPSGRRALVGLESAPMDALGRAGRVERLTIQPRIAPQKEKQACDFET